MLILVDLFNKLNMIQINQICKRKLVTQTQKFLIIAELLKKTDYNAKITEMESKIPCITLLATNAALFIVENKLPNVSNLV